MAILVAIIMATIIATIVKSSRIYLFVSDIITVTATTEMVMPTTIFVVRGSPNISVPTRIAVIGSKTPNTDAFVAPILRVATARVAVDTMVGNSAIPKRLSQARPLSRPVRGSISEKIILPRKIIAPTSRA